MKLKVRAYALFQFVSFVAIMFLVVAFGLFVAATISNQEDNTLIVSHEIGKVFTFQTDQAASQVGSVCIYIAIILFIFTWIIGWSIFSIKDRNFFDSMFLMFVMFPLISNFFALLAQLTLNVSKFTPNKLSKEEIEAEKTRVIELMEKKYKTTAKAPTKGKEAKK